MKETLKKLFGVFGLEIIRSRAHLENILLQNGFDVVLDVGANVGQFAGYIRSHGYRGRIVSFEPVKEAFDVLKSKMQADTNWTGVNIGLGKKEFITTINVSRSSVYSSILRPLPIIRKFAGRSIETCTQQELKILPLDSLFSEYTDNGKTVFLKIDTQGYENDVLLGAVRSLEHIKGVQAEVSLTPMYEGETPLPGLVALLESHGFRMVLIDPVTYDKASGTLLQVDCIFLKEGFGPFSEDSPGTQHR